MIFFIGYEIEIIIKTYIYNYQTFFYRFNYQTFRLHLNFHMLEENVGERDKHEKKRKERKKNRKIK